MTKLASSHVAGSVARLKFARTIENEPTKTPTTTKDVTTTRARRPLFADNPLVLEGKPTDGGCEVWAIDPDGYVAMTIAAEFK